MSMARPDLTSTEKNLLKNFVDTLTKTKSTFCCGGIIDMPSEQKLNLFYHLGSAEHARRISLPATENEAIEGLLKASAPAPHGRGAETVYDESYRLARELHSGNFALAPDLVNKSGILESIATLTSSRDSSKLVAELYKLNCYSTGGFFKSHRDTPKSDTHVGSLVIALPVPFEGGALRVSHEGKEVLFDWATAMSPHVASGNVGLPWAFLFSDVEHEVLPVTSGTRVTLAYEIFSYSTKTSSAVPVVDGMTLPLYSDLLTLLKNPDFLPKGGKLGLALSHSYPINVSQDSAAFASHFKGRDAILHRVISDLKIPMELRAVYTPNDARYYGEDSEYRNDKEVFEELGITPFPSDGFGPVYKDADNFCDILIFTSKEFQIMESEGLWEEGETEVLKSMISASFEPDVIWACKPTSDAFSHSGNYVSYGNEASVQSVYAAAALVLDIPATGQGVRTSF